MFDVYIIRSLKSGRYYIGSTGDIVQRLRQHNSGSNRSTKAYRPWKVVYTQRFATHEAAFKRERQIKSYKGGRAFKVLIQSTKQGEVA